MVDKMLSLAFSVYNNKGIYALLLGSGVSRSAEIPTGWEVLLDLIRQLAQLEGETIDLDPFTWYTNKYNQEPTYSGVLGAVAQSPAERSNLLRKYFEATPEQRQENENLKTPTPAHKAIAQLMARGYVKVVITTNFDRLMEQALEAIGITPIVISSADALEGAMPLVHASHIILKLHGDYLDLRTKNTPVELEAYDPRLTNYLDRILDEFGIIISGWSADWDTALRSAFERARSQRFTTYWTHLGNTSETTNNLIALRRASEICIANADSFFQDLHEKVTILENSNNSHPLSPSIAVARTKKYLEEDRYKIKLSDLLRTETNKLCEQLAAKHVASLSSSLQATQQRQQLESYLPLIEILSPVIATVAYWGEEQHIKEIIRCIEKVAFQINSDISRTCSHLFQQRRFNEQDDSNDWIEFFAWYPLAFLLYSVGVVAIAREKYNFVAALLSKPVIRNSKTNDTPMLLAFNNWKSHYGIQLETGTYNYLFPTEFIFNSLKDPLKEYFTDELHYTQCFAEFEYLLSLVFADKHKEKNDSVAAMFGTALRLFPIPNNFFYYANRQQLDQAENKIINTFDQEADKLGLDWHYLKLGLFGQSIEHFKAIKQEHDTAAKGWRDWLIQAKSQSRSLVRQ